MEEFKMKFAMLASVLLVVGCGSAPSDPDSHVSERVVCDSTPESIFTVPGKTLAQMTAHTTLQNVDTGKYYIYFFDSFGEARSTDVCGGMSGIISGTYWQYNE
jgi:hypothetical protein